MAHHKRKRPKQRRGGCLLCKPHKLTANAKSERRKGRRDWTLNERAAGDHGDRNQLYLNTGLKRVGNAPGWIRTSDPRIRSPMLYPAELRGLVSSVALQDAAEWG